MDTNRAARIDWVLGKRPEPRWSTTPAYRPHRRLRTCDECGNATYVSTAKLDDGKRYCRDCVLELQSLAPALRPRPAPSL